MIKIELQDEMIKNELEVEMIKEEGLGTSAYLTSEICRKNLT
jgi:hypothetical protein